MKNKKKIVIVFCCILLFCMCVGKIVMTNLINEVNKIVIVDPDLSNVADGKYIGEYSFFPVYVKVEVTIENHELINIDILEHDNGLGGLAESMTNDIVEKQSLNIDVVSGATISSQCILKAVENAIEKEKSYA